MMIMRPPQHGHGFGSTRGCSDSAVQSVAGDRGQGDPAVVQLTSVYDNLLRRWADA